MFGLLTSPLHLPLSSSPRRASYRQLPVLKGLVYGCELVFHRENWEVFRVTATASLLPLDSFQTYWSAFREEPRIQSAKTVKIKATGL